MIRVSWDTNWVAFVHVISFQDIANEIRLADEQLSYLVCLL